MNKTTDIITEKKIQENEEIKKATDRTAEKADEESARMHSRRIAASWLMEVIRHLYIAAEAMDRDTVKATECFWKTESMGMVSNDWKQDADINMNSAYYHMLFGREGMEEYLRTVSIVPEPEYFSDEYNIIRPYLPDIAVNAIMDLRSKRNERTDDEMSFVGMMILDDGVLAFGDTKGTRKFADGTMRCEEGRIVQKVFIYDGILLMTHGLNEVSFGNGVIRMEDYINDCMSRKVNIYDMMERLRESVILEQIEEENKKKTREEDKIPAQYWFTYSRDGASLESFIISRKERISASLMTKEENANCIPYITCRNADYDDAFRDFANKLNSEGYRKTDEVMPRLKAWLENRIHEMDERLEYNSVGLPLQLAVLKTGYAE